MASIIDEVCDVPSTLAEWKSVPGYRHPGPENRNLPPPITSPPPPANGVPRAPIDRGLV
ncbi:hypothetical protein VDGL01_01837 [Verticillium dahliae]